MSSLPFLSPDEFIPGTNGLRTIDFWQWAYSDVLSNRNRSIFAEFIVGAALGVVNQPRVEWNSVDLEYGTFHIEVKSSGDCQSWTQSKPSRIAFSIRKALFWNPATGMYVGEATRSAHCYVFCHYPERDKGKANVLDVPAWDFYVMTTQDVNAAFGEAKSVSLANVRAKASRCKFGDLKKTVDRALSSTRACSAAV
jgi:hypothetical protein